jgi:hypothetical protein
MEYLMDLLILRRMHLVSKQIVLWAGIISAGAPSSTGQAVRELDLKTALITEPGVRIVSGSGAGGEVVTG